MTVLTFRAEWHGERAAGINHGSEEITISFKDTDIIEPETIDYWREMTVNCGHWPRRWPNSRSKFFKAGLSGAWS